MSVERLPTANKSYSVQERENKQLKLSSSMLHYLFPTSAPPYTDRLKQLYPQEKDLKIRLDERSHTYFVDDVAYSFSVSSWWQSFFPRFQPDEISSRIVHRHSELSGFRDEDGLRETVPDEILRSSVYNLKQHIRIFEEGSNSDFLLALADTVEKANTKYSQDWSYVPFSVEQLIQMGIALITSNAKPSGRSCYYLFSLYSDDKTHQQKIQSLIRTWELHGKIESLKGSFLHKRIELFINALGVLVFLCNMIIPHQKLQAYVDIQCTCLS